MNYYLVLMVEKADEPAFPRLRDLEQLLKAVTGEFSGVVKVKNDDGKTVIRTKTTGEFVTRLRRNYTRPDMPGRVWTQTAFIVTTSATKAVVNYAALLALPSSVTVTALDATEMKIEYNSSDDLPIIDDMYT